jgi:hypothetical protein
MCSEGGVSVLSSSSALSSADASSSSCASASTNLSAKSSNSASTWVCKICNMMSMINNTAEGENEELSQFYIYPGKSVSPIETSILIV